MDYASDPALNQGALADDHGSNCSLLEVSRGYVREFGFAIIPVGRNKVPLMEQWQKSRSGIVEALEQVLLQNPSANLGCVTGSASQIVVLDVDVSHGQDGSESLKQLEERFGALPKTPIVRTPSGGEHYYFRHAGPPLKRRIKFREGLDFLAEDSYAVMPPSIGLNGRPYCWDVEADIEDVPFALVPQWLVQVTQCNQPQMATGRRPCDWEKRVSHDVSEGSRNDTLARLSGHLLRSRVDPYVVRELVLCFNAVRLSPPLPEKEASRVVDSIVKKEWNRRQAARGAA